MRFMNYNEALWIFLQKALQRPGGTERKMQIKNKNDLNDLND